MSLIGTKCRGRLTMSAPEGKTDVPREPRHFRFLTHNGLARDPRRFRLAREPYSGLGVVMLVLVPAR
jgi:hypothetical protein